jgi:hypothetical protein
MQVHTHHDHTGTLSGLWSMDSGMARQPRLSTQRESPALPHTMYSGPTMATTPVQPLLSTPLISWSQCKSNSPTVPPRQTRQQRPPTSLSNSTSSEKKVLYTMSLQESMLCTQQRGYGMTLWCLFGRKPSATDYTFAFLYPETFSIDLMRLTALLQRQQDGQDSRSCQGNQAPNTFATNVRRLCSSFTAMSIKYPKYAMFRMTGYGSCTHVGILCDRNRRKREATTETNTNRWRSCLHLHTPALHPSRNSLQTISFRRQTVLVSLRRVQQGAHVHTQRQRAALPWRLSQ